MPCAICGRTVGLNKVYGDKEFCPEHSEKDLPKEAEVKEEVITEEEPIGNDEEEVVL